MRYGCVMRMMTMMMMETNKHRCKVLEKRTAGDQIPDGGEQHFLGEGTRQLSAQLSI